MYNNKKGQAALEFLMTYGWAILAAIIVIGALGSYFYFNQGTTDTVFINAPFGSIASRINGTVNTIEFDFANKAGEALGAVTIDITNGGCDTLVVGDMSSGVASAPVTLINCGTLGTGTFQGALTITYTRPGSAIVLSSSGSISGPVR